MARKKRGCFARLMFLCNSGVAFLLILAYLLPYIPPKTFPFLAVLSLGMPVLIFWNILFLAYWFIGLKRELFLSLVVLAIGYNHLISFYKFTSAEKPPSDRTIDIMSYNVRQFNRFRWIKSDRIPFKIQNYINSSEPDIVCFQEYYSKNGIRLPAYKHRFVKDKSRYSGQAIFSKQPVVRTGSLDFDHTANNAIYADVVMHRDTVRIFNIHLESLKIDPKMGTIESQSSKKLISRMGQAFKKQQTQVELITKAVSKSPYKTIICGDMNNTAFSYVYRKLATGYQDAFTEAGNGFGRSFNLKWLPLRIDICLVDPALTVLNYHNDLIESSDHFPITTTVGFPD